MKFRENTIPHVQDELTRPSSRLPLMEGYRILVLEAAFIFNFATLRSNAIVALIVQTGDQTLLPRVLLLLG